jgi:hypothetical protein
MFRKTTLAASFGATMMLASATPTFAQFPDLLQMNGTPEDRAACEPDARRYCKNAMPDNMRVLSCLQQNRRKISRACQAVLTKYGQ